MAVYGEELVERRQEVHDKSADVPKIEGLTSTVSALESKLTTSQSESQKSKERLPALFKRSNKSANVAVNAELVASDLWTKLQSSEWKSKGLPTALQVARAALADLVAIVEKSTALSATTK